MLLLLSLGDMMDQRRLINILLLPSAGARVP
jgi:hypothetical protein